MKKTKLTVAGIALAGVLFVGGTYAFLTGQTSEKKNTFTMGNGITAELAEPRWDGVCFTDDKDCPVIPEGEQGVNIAKTFTPDMAIPKDPTIKNTSEGGNPVYVAVTIDYDLVIEEKKISTTYAELESFLELDFAKTGWAFNESKTVAYYTKELEAGKQTNPVFSAVNILSTATHPDQNTVDSISPTTMKDFEITVKGYITQTGVNGSDDYKATLISAFPVLDKN